MDDPPSPELIRFLIQSIHKILKLEESVKHKRSYMTLEDVVDITILNIQLIHEIYGPNVTSLDTGEMSIPPLEKLEQFKSDLSATLHGAVR